MKRYRILLLFIALVGTLSTFSTWKNAAHAQPGITISDSGVEISFPEQLTFRASISGSNPIQQVVLEYGVKKQTCGTVVAKAFPSFTPGTETSVSWTWVMRKSHP